MAEFSGQDIRYQRQLIMPEIGWEGQEKLRRGKVFIAGLGGLGSLSCYYLAAAGIGCLKIADRDRVELSNLNRQILHWIDDIGKDKVESAAAKISRFNPECRLETFCGEVTVDNAHEIVGDCALIVDAGDNLDLRRVLNRVSLDLKIPFIYGGVNGFDGMVSTFIPGTTACLECLFGHIIAKNQMIGVIGVTPALIASIQVMEVIKLLVGIPGGLINRLLYIKGLNMKFKELAIAANPQCLVCGEKDQ